MSCHRTIIRLSAVLAVVALTKGCGDGDSPAAPPTPEPARPTTVTVSPATHELTALGATVQLSAEVRDQNARVMAGATVTWTSSASSMATVDASGLVTAAGNGTATITASVGSASGSAVVTVTQSVASVEVSPSAETIELGSTLQLTAEAFDESGHAVAEVEFAWETSDATVATVDASGLVTGVAVGVATITASAGSAQGTAEITVGLNPDRATLVALYEATDGPSWVDAENWLTDAPLGEWYGVDTDAEGRVVRLDLAGNTDNWPEVIPHGLSGPIPPELGSLTHLTGLYLQVNQLSGPIPPELGNLANLTRLGLGSNQLAGPIPAELGNLASLTRLALSGNQLAGPIPAELGNLASLTRLALSGNQLAGPIPPDLGNLASLTWLALSGNQLAGPIPPDLGNLSNLRVLQLAASGLTGRIPPELGNLKNLTILELMANHLSGPIPPELGNLANLRTIYAFSNRLAGPLPPQLGKLSRLSDLELSANPLLVGPLPATFAEMDNLNYLIIERTGLCIPQTTEFQLWLRGVNTVRGENCAIVQEADRDALAAIYRWANGDGWRSNENWLSDEPLDSWYGVTASSSDKVTALDLSDNNLAGIVPAETGNLLYIEDLVLNGNSALGGELPIRILQLTSLSTLRLDGTGVCTSAAPVFQIWLDGIADARAMACPDDHGNDALGATSIAVGERAEGELESYLDEDWFRVEVSGRGTLSVAAEGNTVVHGELHDADGALVGYDYDGSFGSFSIVRHVTPGAYYVRVTGQTEETRGTYTLVSSFEPRTSGVRAYLTQAVQSHDFTVPLVAGEDALLRVFVMAGSGVTASMPPVLATFYRGGQEVYSVRIDGSSQPVPQTMAESDLDGTANAVIPSTHVLPGTEMVVEVDPDGTLDPSLGIGGRIPREGRMALDIRSMPDFDVTAVPFLWAADPDSSGFKATIGLTADHDAFYETRDWLPIAKMTATVREPVLVDYDPNENMDLVLQDVALLLVADGASGYYMGVPPWIDRGLLGIASLGSRASVSRFEGHTIAHEFGHNFLLRHAPCGGPEGADGEYPHSGGRIGAWGYDFRDGTLVDPDVFTDLMTYCRTNDWISDYSFTKAADYRTETQATMASRTAGRVLVVRGGVAGGQLRIEPAFVLDAPATLPDMAGPYRLVGSDSQGGELFAVRFEMQEVADPEAEGDAGFTFAIPVQAEWAEALAAITLTGPGPEGSVALARDDPVSSAAALVLDAGTGRIRAIFRELPGQAVAADRAPYTPPGTVTLFSRGLPDAVAWRR